jgi:hypothetical protein
VRCAIDTQESLRTRNMAYPPSRQMCFRIGITVGDVVERDGDLLGDGVNIAARLEGIAPIGGICISRTVHEQVANKLSVQFADIGEQQVKNIPTPVHAYHIAMRPDDAQGDAKKNPAKSNGVPIAIAAACAVLLSVSGLAYKALFQPGAPLATSQAPQQAAPAPPPTVLATDSLASASASKAPPPPAPRAAEALVPDTVPLITDRGRVAIRDEYMSAADHKALAISPGPIGLSTGQADDETAKAAALDMCQQRANALPQQRKCELYAVGNTVVYARGRPPMPPTPWVTHDPSTERPVVPAEVPMLRDAGKTAVERTYLPGHSPKAIALGPLGGYYFLMNQQSDDEAARRVLELCANNAGVPCMVVALNENFVVPVPTIMKATGFFHAAKAEAIAPGLRDDVARRLGNGSGWTAVAVGAGGQAGVMLKAANEQAAIDGAMADCAKQDSSCRVIGIGPFTVEAR